jgi:hypothetical protein
MLGAQDADSLRASACSLCMTAGRSESDPRDMRYSFQTSLMPSAEVSRAARCLMTFDAAEPIILA